MVGLELSGHGWTGVVRALLDWSCPGLVGLELSGPCWTGVVRALLDWSCPGLVGLDEIYEFFPCSFEYIVF